MAFTTPRTWTAGEFVTDTMMNAHVRDNFGATMHLLAYKSVDESVISSTALQNDDTLLVAVAASEVWYVKFVAFVVDVSGAAHLKAAFTWPAGATVGISTVWSSTVPTMDTFTYSTSGTSAANLQSEGANIPFVIEFNGVIANGGTPGSLTMQWAQVSSNVSALTMKKGSVLLGMKLA